MRPTHIKRGDIVSLRFDFDKRGALCDGMRVKVVHVPESFGDNWCFDNGTIGKEALVIMSDNTPGLKSITKV